MRSFKTKCEVLHLVQNFKILSRIYLISKFWLHLLPDQKIPNPVPKQWKAFPKGIPGIWNLDFRIWNFKLYEQQNIYDDQAGCGG